MEKMSVASRLRIAAKLTKVQIHKVKMLYSISWHNHQ